MYVYNTYFFRAWNTTKFGGKKVDSFSTNVKEISLAGDHLKKRSPYSMKYWLFKKDPGSLYWVIIDYIPYILSYYIPWILIYLGSFHPPTNPLTNQGAQTVYCDSLWPGLFFVILTTSRVFFSVFRDFFQSPQPSGSFFIPEGHFLTPDWGGYLSTIMLATLTVRPWKWMVQMYFLLK